MIEKRRERGFIYRRGWGLVDVGVEVGGGLLIELEIREDVEFEDCAICVEGAFVRAED